jgi:hypothetical protein
MPDSAECRTARNAKGRANGAFAAPRSLTEQPIAWCTAGFARSVAFGAFMAPALSGIRAVRHSAPFGIPRCLAFRAVLRRLALRRY